MSDQVVSATDSTFTDDVLRSPIPVLVDFWAPWCGPCKIIAPVIEELAIEYENRFKFVKLNTDENGMTAAQYGIMSIPTLGIFKDGKMVDAVIGAVPRRILQAKLEEHVPAVAGN
jgi:thioredoxin 1